MQLPDFMNRFPAVRLPFPEDTVTTRAIRSEAGLAVWFTVHEDVTIPEHSHKAQWGMLIAGEMDLTVAGETRTCRPGDTWDIPEGTPHAALIRAGSVLMDVFEESDRYSLTA